MANRDGNREAQELKRLRRKAVEVRLELLAMIYEAKTGHTGGSLSATEIMVTLHHAVMRIDPSNPGWEDRDRFVLSKGHSVEVYYALLADLGFFSRDELKTFCQYGSRLIGHPSVKVPGVEINTGSLGHGLPVGIGMAMAGRLDRKDYRVYVLMGDGEQNEGSVWEAAMAAGHYGLDNLVGIIDRNGLQISGDTEQVMRLENLRDKWAAFGWEVLETDGNEIGLLLETFDRLPVAPGRPHLIIAKTVKGKGLSMAENAAKWHHGVPDEAQYEQARRELEAQLEHLRC